VVIPAVLAGVVVEISGAAAPQETGNDGSLKGCSFFYRC
jgi:hypothetical protein